MISRAKELTINVDTDVNKQLADIQRSSKIADPEKFQEFVRQETGMPYEDYKSELKNQMLTNRVIRQEVSGKINFKKEELEKPTTTRIRTNSSARSGCSCASCWFPPKARMRPPWPSAEKKAKDLSARAKKGEKFEDTGAGQFGLGHGAAGRRHRRLRKGEAARRISKSRCGTSRAALSPTRSTSATDF